MEIRLDDPPMLKLGSHDDPFGSSSSMGALGIIGGEFVVAPLELGTNGSVEDFWLKKNKSNKISVIYVYCYDLSYRSINHFHLFKLK